MNFIQALDAFPEHAEQIEKSMRRAHWILRAQLAAWLTGGVIMTASTAKLIQDDAPWWVITFGVLITIPWGIGASRMRPTFERLRELRATHAMVQDVVQDDGFREFVKIFSGPNDVADEEPSTTEAPTTPAPTKYRKRPVIIEAMEFGPTPTDAHALTSWMSANLYVGLVGNALDPGSLRYHDQIEGDDSTPDKGWYIDPADGALMIRTLEGDMRTSPGDYVIHGVEGEFYPCKPDIFAKTYELLPTPA